MLDPRDRRAALRDRLVLAVASALVAVALFLPRPLNFAPLGAFGLFVGAYAPGRRSWLYPFLALGAYVATVGAYPWFVLIMVVLGFAGPALLGVHWLRDRVGVGRVVGAALGSSVWFFLISNFGSWVVYGVARGETLFAHYLLGLPFFRNTVAGDLFFSALLFGGYALVDARLRSRALAATTLAG